MTHEVMRVFPVLCVCACVGTHWKAWGIVVWRLWMSCASRPHNWTEQDYKKEMYLIVPHCTGTCVCVCVWLRIWFSWVCWWKCGWMTSLFLCVSHKWKCNWVIKHRHNMQETAVMSTHPKCFLHHKHTHTKLFDSWIWGVSLVPNDFSLFWITSSIGKTHPTKLSDIITQRWVTHLLTYSLRGE